MDNFVCDPVQKNTLCNKASTIVCVFYFEVVLCIQNWSFHMLLLINTRILKFPLAFSLNLLQDFRMGDNKLPRVTTTKFLGMWIDQNLNWNEHISKLKTKVKRNLTLLKIGQKHLNTHTKKMLYYAQIYSHLSYGLVLWGNMVNKNQADYYSKAPESSN